MEMNGNTRVGQIAVEHPLATRVFGRHDIDYCCGGGVPLKDACASKNLETDDVLAEIRREVEGSQDSEGRWDRASLSDLIDHILTEYHDPLRPELAQLEEMMSKVVRVHGDKEPEMLPKLSTVFEGLKVELEEHMAKEEQILFPLIQSGRGAMADGPISVMEHEHEAAGAALRRLRELTHGYTVPENACNTWRALWHRLEELEAALHRHIHLENNILFPRALSS